MDFDDWNADREDRLGANPGYLGAYDEMMVEAREMGANEDLLEWLAGAFDFAYHEGRESVGAEMGPCRVPGCTSNDGAPTHMCLRHQLMASPAVVKKAVGQ